MNELRRQFISEAIVNLENLLARLRTERFAEAAERDIFRTLHTLKGTSQTFDLNVSGRLAHEIENLLQAKRDEYIKPNYDFAALLKEGIELLLETFRRAESKKEVAFPAEYVGRIHDSTPNQSVSLRADILSLNIPHEFLAQMSAQEQLALSSAVAGGKQFYLIEAGFDFSAFAAQFKSMQEALRARGETIAVFPSPKFAAANKIGFQIFFVGNLEKDEIIKLIEPFDGTLPLQRNDRNFSNDLNGILAQAVLTGEKTAEKLGKKIEFEVVAGEIELSNKQLKVFSETLLHLIRNAADHAIDQSGTVTIEAFEREDDFVLRVADNGRGIDAEKVRAKAIAENLIAADALLTRAETLELIFAHGFSTSETISEISGRGVGLDAVKDAVEKSGGEILVESAPGKGTTFEMRLPKET